MERNFNDNDKDFIDLFAKHDIALIMVHHATKKGDELKGPVQLERVFENIIYLHGKDCTDYSYEITESNQNDLWNNGEYPVETIADMRIEKTKFLSELQNQSTTIAHLKNGNWVIFGGYRPSTSSCAPNNHHQEGLSEYDPDELSKTDLSPRQIAICEVLHSKSSVSTKDIVVALDKTDNKAGEDTVRADLRDLISKGIVSKGGQNKSTYYTLSKKACCLFAPDNGK